MAQCLRIRTVNGTPASLLNDLISDVSLLQKVSAKLAGTIESFTDICIAVDGGRYEKVINADEMEFLNSDQVIQVMLVHSCLNVDLDTVFTVDDLKNEIFLIEKKKVMMAGQRVDKRAAAVRVIETVEQLVRLNYFAFELVGFTLLLN